jgi:hypothetical protein
MRCVAAYLPVAIMLARICATQGLVESVSSCRGYVSPTSGNDIFRGAKQENTVTASADLGTEEVGAWPGRWATAIGFR